MLYIPSTQKTKISLDVEFDEYFKTAIAYTWKPFNDALTLRPKDSNPTLLDGASEFTGDISDSKRLEEEVKDKGIIDINSFSDHSSQAFTNSQQTFSFERIISHR